MALIGGAGLVGRALSELIQHHRGADVVPFYLAALLLIGLGMAAIRGLIAVAPGEARVVQLFGSYAGTIRGSGLRWVNPLSRRIKISTRIRNHETALAKVNDAEGNPIEIAAVVVWQVE
ncbi:MAG TPA: SPFH domain-containing protein, partial [Candidatus Acidoferrum sp.]|nr:SPFH domain-containing protein [Candidatus Acidoferrum sp.]